MLYKDILDVNKNFQYSVNIDYDLFNENKIKEYIPTSDVCDVLKIYIKSILGYENNRSTLLVGPYGKGKSFLILSLLRIVCFERNKYTDILLNKIKIVDKELYDYINEIYKKKIKLLPVIIDSNYYNIEQSFLLALNESLRNFKLDKIVPNTVYDVCLELIDIWESKDGIGKDAIKKCQKQTGITIKDLKKGLKSYNKDAYYKFESLYNCLTPGLSFNPLVNTDIVKTYSDINNQIKKYGYSGMFIVYDEFSKTLESGNTFLGHDLKIIQDFAEKSSRSSKDEQMNLCCITHKAFDLYFKDDKTSTMSDAFKTVSGRFKEIRFNRSLDQNYQIISFTLNKKEKTYNAECLKFINKNSKFYNELSSTGLFDESDEKILYKKCFPFNPISIYILIRLSELIAQNERTMFTLISDTDENSFNSFINNNGSNLYNVYNLYNYFSPLFENDSSEIKEIWLKCEAACKKIVSKDKRNILKTLAIIEMINDFSKISPTIELIALMNFKDNNIIKKEINELIDEKVLKKSLGNNYLDFAYSYAREIDNEIEKIVQIRKNSINVSNILNIISDDLFIIPRKYNANYKITRFFKSLYLDENDFVNLNSFSLLFKENYCDGLNIRLFNINSDIKVIKKHFEKMECNNNVIVTIPSNSTKLLEKEAIKLSAMFEYEESIKDDENILTQINMMISEKKKEMNYVIKSIYDDGEVVYLSDSKCGDLLNITTDLCERNFDKTPIVNNEMINKRNVTSAYQKPRNAVLDMFLNQSFNMNAYSTTSPEMTIYNTFFNDGKLNEDSNKIVNSIKKELLTRYSNKRSFEPIVVKYMSSPYGIRRGVLPIYLSLAISNMDDNIVLYYENAEIDINASNIDKICDEPNKYFALVEEKSKEQDDYLKKLIKLFNGNATDSFYLNTKLASNLIRKWAIGLPMIIKETHTDDNFLKIQNEFIILKDVLLKYNLNSYELLFKDIPFIFKNSYERVIKSIKEYLTFEKKIDDYTNCIAKNVKNMFIKNYKGSIAGCYKQWEINNNVDFSYVIFEGKSKELYKLLTNVNHNNIDAINQISTLIIGYNVSDWAGNYEDKIYSSISDLIISSKKKPSKNNANTSQLSTLGQMFQNNIESVVDEFADSITNEEKVEILNSIINKYLGAKK